MALLTLRSVDSDSLQKSPGLFLYCANLLICVCVSVCDDESRGVVHVKFAE